jgi:hypothetical protein
VPAASTNDRVARPSTGRDGAPQRDEDRSQDRDDERPEPDQSPDAIDAADWQARRVMSSAVNMATLRRLICSRVHRERQQMIGGFFSRRADARSW